MACHGCCSDCLHPLASDAKGAYIGIGCQLHGARSVCRGRWRIPVGTADGAAVDAPARTIFSSNAIYLLTSLLRAIQSKVDPARDFAIRSLNEQNQLNRMLMGFLGLAFWTGLTVIFFNTRCEDLNYLPDARRCQNGEVLMGLHGPFSSVYYANYFGIMVFSPLVFAGFSALREWVRRRFVPTKEHD